MKPDLSQLAAACQDVDKRFVEQHVKRLGERYFESFGPDEVCAHIRAVASLSNNAPVRTIVEKKHDSIVCTVVAFDCPSELSVIAGLFAGTGFSVDSGLIFTYQPARYSYAAIPRRFGRIRERNAVSSRRCIIDRFSGKLENDLYFEEWRSKITSLLNEAMSLLQSGTNDAQVCARHMVNEMVSARLAKTRVDSGAVFYPVGISVDNDSGIYTTLKISAQDTPAFLYSLCNALSLSGISIERVQISTRDGKVEDEIDVLDSRGNKIVDEAALGRIKMSVLLTKQFTYFLATAPDPYAALARFQILAADIPDSPGHSRWLDMLSDPKALQDLARILGASDFLWEDFIRSQYEALLPIIGGSGSDTERSFTVQAIRARLSGLLDGVTTPARRLKIINEFKDREIFLIDLEHILNSGADVTALAEPLTALAEVVVDAVSGTVFDELSARYGMPGTVAGLPARWAVFGLGKMGGVALGYASDIELLFVYSDAGKTDGAMPIDNAEFFDRLASETATAIEAKQAGIFHVDLRLRPYGNSGPKACSLDGFCRYYGPAGPAHSYEKLALTRLRVVCGDNEFGARVERLRNEFVYEARSLDIEELRLLRKKQFEEKVGASGSNAKFSPGALVDLEYCVQILQVMHGGGCNALRTPRIHEALEALAAEGVLDKLESKVLTDAYYFFRRLINGLRMLRGNALDLLMPPEDSDEYAHLARRMGYERISELDPSRNLRLDFDTQTAVVRSFMAKHFGRGSIPGSGTGNIADVVLSDDAPEDVVGSILGKAGFRDVPRALKNIRLLAGEGAVRRDFAGLAVLAFDMLVSSPDPDMALNNWERFVCSLEDPSSHYMELLAQPGRFEVILAIFSGSQFLSDTLVRNPDFLDWATEPERLKKPRTLPELRKDIFEFVSEDADYRAWLNAMRKFRRRELLRIGARDMCVGVDTAEITSDLSMLADAVTGVMLDREWREYAGVHPEIDVSKFRERFCVLAFGKLGGCELNYSSDIDLVGVYDADFEKDEREASVLVFAGIMEKLRASLSSHTEEGCLYRVDLRLRAHGTSGLIVQASDVLARYYQQQAALWEVQALLKARPIAGNSGVGENFLRSVRHVFSRERSWREIARSVQAMRDKSSAGEANGDDVKSGVGGIRDVEFLVQALQLFYCPVAPAILTGNTLNAVASLAAIGVLSESDAGVLKSDYLFLRKIEHWLQILEDRQIHALPKNKAQQEALARRMSGGRAKHSEFAVKLHEAQARVRGIYNRYFEQDFLPVESLS